MQTQYSETCLNQTLSKPKTCLSQTDLTVPSTECLCNLNLCNPNTCLNWTNSSVPKGFGLDRFYCIIVTDAPSIMTDFPVVKIYVTDFPSVKVHVDELSSAQIWSTCTNSLIKVNSELFLLHKRQLTLIDY